MSDSNVAAPAGGLPARSGPRSGVLPVIAPWLFVLLWSTGFVGAKYGLPYAEPFTFLLVRTASAGLLFLIIARVVGARVPPPGAEFAHVAVGGLFIHAGYLGGVYYAIKHGMPAGLTSLFVGLQPVLTAVIAQSLLRERLSTRQWLGLALGFAGVALVVEERVGAALDQPIQHGAFVAAIVALLSTTAGALYQKRFVRQSDLTVSAGIQYLVAAAVMGVLAIIFESMHIEWTVRFVLAQVWLVLVVGLGANLLLLWLIREHSVSRISSLLYLVPSVTALEAYLLFDERLGLTALLGVVLTGIGVFAVLHQGRWAIS